MCLVLVTLYCSAPQSGLSHTCAETDYYTASHFIVVIGAFAVQQKSMSDLAIKLNCTRAFLPVEICERLSNRFDFMT